MPKTSTTIGDSATRLAAAGLVLCALAGCSRQHYRRDADSETYRALAEKAADPRWNVPELSIEPPPESRLFDPTDPDHPPMPPDDDDAHEYMHCVDGKHGYAHWYDDGESLSIEAPDWQSHLPRRDDGSLRLAPDSAVELAILHSREYQSELEDLYFSALALTLNRFEFQTQWFGRNSTTYQHSGTSSVPAESNTLTAESALGFSRSLATGGQLLADFANSFVWEYTGSDRGSVTSTINLSLVQPLLRRAGREVRLEALTQAERDVLYSVRGFARFRKQFYFNVVAGRDGYFSLLLQTQNIRNLEANLASLERNQREHEALAEALVASAIQVDQVFQSYQAGRLALTQAQNILGTALDSYKITLGLPPSLPMELDDSLLAPFQLTDPALTDLEGQIERFLAVYRELDEAPPLDRLQDGFKKLTPFHARLGTFLNQVAGETTRWRSQIPDEGKDETTARERAAQQQLTERVNELREDLEDLRKELDKEASALNEETRQKGWLALQRLAREQSALVGELFVIQTQARVYLIKLRPIELDPPTVTTLALENRLDLMNQRARVVDAWRRITVTADALESDLDLVAAAGIGAEPGGDNPFRFSAAGSTYRLGFRLDGPLNRKAERNIYRTQLVNYQRARRAYMAAADGVQQAIRRDLRQLETDRLNFEIARQSLIIAARQVELTRAQLVAPGPAGDSSNTQDVLDALNRLLQSKNALIGIWVSYEIGHLQLMLDMEALELDARGVYTDESLRPRAIRPQLPVELEYRGANTDEPKPALDQPRRTGAGSI